MMRSHGFLAGAAVEKACGSSLPMPTPCPGRGAKRRGLRVPDAVQSAARLYGRVASPARHRLPKAKVRILET
jgi:hypothetical protein